MNQTNPLLQYIMDFAKELMMRLKTKSPKFFQIIAWTLGAVSMATYIPETVQWVAHQLDLTVPDAFMVTVNWAVAKVSTFGAFICLLTTNSAPIGVTQDGSILKVTNELKLPFTAKQEQKQAIKKDVPLVENIIPLKPDQGN